MQLSLETILEMPDAYLPVERVKLRLADEQKRGRHFYEIVEENKKTEFINGDILFHSLVAKHKLGFVGVEKIMVSPTRNDYKPDVCFFGNEKAKKFTAKQMKFPAPDFVVEVLWNSTARVDREMKFQDYAAHGVEEYWIIDPEKETVEQYFLQEESYELLLKVKHGAVESVVLPKFKIPIRAIFDESENLKALANSISE